MITQEEMNTLRDADCICRAMQHVLTETYKESGVLHWVVYPMRDGLQVTGIFNGGKDISALIPYDAPERLEREVREMLSDERQIAELEAELAALKARKGAK